MASPKRKGWKLLWADEFDGKHVDRKKWEFDIGNGFCDDKNHAWVEGWGNEELQYYTDAPANVSVQGGARLYPDKSIVITEAGWCTNSNGRGMNAEHAVQELQAIYLRDLIDWTDGDGILCFVFEAFDEPWKGSPPLEPEKHWGLYTVNRQPKLVMSDWR